MLHESDENEVVLTFLTGFFGLVLFSAHRSPDGSLFLVQVHPVRPE